MAEKYINKLESKEKGEEGFDQEVLIRFKNKLQRLRKIASRKDYYKILEIPKTASKEEIKKAYRKQALKFHPDRAKSNDEKVKKQNESKFRDVSEAYEVLSDENKKQRYDSGEDPNEPEGGFNPFGDFQHFFRPGSGGQTFTFSFGGKSGSNSFHF